ncbi:Zinc finger, C2H2 type, partial [Rhizoctonia solani]
MSSAKAEVNESELTIGLARPDCGDQTSPGANINDSDSGPPTPNPPTLALPKLVKRENDDDDPLTYLVELFGLTTLDDSDDSGDSDDSDDDSENESEPRDKALNNKSLFYAGGRLYYYDDFRRVYSEGGTLIHDGFSDLLSPFQIDGVPYWFSIDGLLSCDTDGTPYSVFTWHNGPDPLDLCELLGPQFISPADPLSQPDLTPYSHHTPSLEPISGQLYPALIGKTEVLSPSVNPNSLQQAFQGGLKPLVWSPTASDQKSPIVSGTSRASSMGPPLFPETQYSLPLTNSIVDKWRAETLEAQQEAARARPVRKADKNERRRCPVCNKIFRRPSSLEDHLNVHSGDKPHVCPFKGCHTGFATKSNMKRHFLTHRVGPLEDYGTGMIHQPDVVYKLDGTGPKKTSRPPTVPYNSRAHHTMRFRVSPN